MSVSRTILIAGAGIGGLTAGLALARKGFRVDVFETAERLEPIGAGIQLSPNATRVLAALGLEPRLQPHVVVPEELVVRIARTGQVLARAPLGAAVAARYGSPYWVIHRGDLQEALLLEVAATPNITLHLGIQVDSFTADPGGITLDIARGMDTATERGDALICADGLWSRLRQRLGHRQMPQFAHHTAWRALVPARVVPPERSRPAVNLWLGHRAHLVHYPVKGGRMINVVAIMGDDWNEAGWSSSGLRRDVLDRFSAEAWHAEARELLKVPENWQKWALLDRTPQPRWGTGAVTLLGDAAHPMLPYLAQGAAMAIEDAAVLADWLARAQDDIAGGLRRYEATRRIRTAKAQRAARRNGVVYHLGGSELFLRTLARFTMGGDKLVRRHDWLYGWKPEAA